MNTMTPAFFIALILMLVSGPPTTSALILSHRGNDPVQSHQSRGWPTGAVDVANFERRLGYWEGPPFGGGEYHLEYAGSTEDLQQVIDLFARIDAPKLHIILHEGPAESMILSDAADRKAKLRYDWSFTIWDPGSYKRLFLNPKSDFASDSPNFRQPLPPPLLDVYLGGAPAGSGIEWSRVKVPPNVTVTDERASSHGYAADKRSVLRGRVVDLPDGKPIAGARVLLTKYSGKASEYDDVASTQCAADGTFELTGVPAGTLRVHAVADGYVPRQIGHAKFAKDTLKEFPAVKLSPAMAVKGTVVDLDGKPLKDLPVRAWNLISADGMGYALPTEPEAKTDLQGRFALTGLPKGSCRIRVQSPGLHMLDSLKAHSVPSDKIMIRIGATGSVRGRVTQGGGAPTDSPYTAEITPEGGNKIGSWGGSSEVKADGSFTFENVPPGRYTVTARPNPGPALGGKDPNERPVEVKAGVTIDVEIAVK